MKHQLNLFLKRDSRSIALHDPGNNCNTPITRRSALGLVATYNMLLPGILVARSVSVFQRSLQESLSSLLVTIPTMGGGGFFSHPAGFAPYLDSFASLGVYHVTKCSLNVVHAGWSCYVFCVHVLAATYLVFASFTFSCGRCAYSWCAFFSS